MASRKWAPGTGSGPTTPLPPWTNRQMGQWCDFRPVSEPSSGVGGSDCGTGLRHWQWFSQPTVSILWTNPTVWTVHTTTANRLSAPPSVLGRETRERRRKFRDGAESIIEDDYPCANRRERFLRCLHAATVVTVKCRRCTPGRRKAILGLPSRQSPNHEPGTPDSFARSARQGIATERLRREGGISPANGRRSVASHLAGIFCVQLPSRLPEKPACPDSLCVRGRDARAPYSRRRGHGRRAPNAKSAVTTLQPFLRLFPIVIVIVIAIGYEVANEWDDD